METNEETKISVSKKILWEARDMLAGAAFPLMLTVILSATVISFIAYGGSDIVLKALILAAGEVMVIAATVIFGKQNGVTAYKKTVDHTNKRSINSDDLKARMYTGEYAPYKGVIIGLIICVPFIIFEIVYAAAPVKFLEFIMAYVFGWGYFPFTLGNLSPWLNLLCVIPFVGVHTAAYIWGGKTEKKKQDIIAAAEEIKAEKKKK